MSDTQEKVVRKGWRERLPLIERAVGSIQPADAEKTARRPSGSSPAAQVARPAALAPSQDPDPAQNPTQNPAQNPAPAAALAGASSPRRSRYAEIDIERLEKLGLLTPKGTRSRTKEEFRVIKRSILQNAFQRGAPRRAPGNLIMVTSAKPDEGKTFTAVNLAISIALERDYTVLLIDGDFARPNVMQMLGLKSGKGMIDVLADPSTDLSDVMVRTNIDKLSVLPAGSSHNLSTEFLASHRMSSLVADIAQRYHDRVVIFDAPPVLATSEATALAMHVGQIVLVVEADKTTKSAVKEALQMIDTGAQIGVVLNRCSKRLGPAQFGTYYYSS